MKYDRHLIVDNRRSSYRNEYTALALRVGWYLNKTEQHARQEVEQQRRQERQAHGLEKRVEFLSFAGAIGLHPVHYADWLVAYLRGGGTAARTPQNFPYEESDSSFTSDSYWLLTNPHVMATDMPAGYGANRMNVFALNQPTFIRQLTLAVQDKLGLAEPFDAARYHHIGPYFKSGMQQAYGYSNVCYLEKVTVPHRFRRPTTSVVGRATRPDAVKLHQDIIPLAYEAAGADPLVLRQLDTIVVNGSNK